MAISLAQRVKRTLIATGIIVAVLGAIYFVSFTTCPIPNGPAMGLVAKYARKDFFKVGDLLLVEMAEAGATTRAVCRIESIEQPDESKRLRARGRGRQLAQAALDMDFKPTYSVSFPVMSSATSTNNQSLPIRESQILGKIIWVFGSKD